MDIHFAEIMFTNHTTYRSLGRRIFDIYIQVLIDTSTLHIDMWKYSFAKFNLDNFKNQGKLFEKDFNIENAAGGVNTPKTMQYHAFVGDHTLEIRFYWAGKGTAALPMRSVYGPLISAISVVHASKFDLVLEHSTPNLLRNKVIFFMLSFCLLHVKLPVSLCTGSFQLSSSYPSKSQCHF